MLAAICAVGWVAWKVQRSEPFATMLVSSVRKASQKRGGWPATNPRTCDRLSFHLIGGQEMDVFIPQAQMPVFPNAVDVRVMGYLGENYVEAGLVIPIGIPDIPTPAASQPPFNCPP